MRTRCIDRRSWSNFAEEISSRHRGWIVDMDVLDPVRGIRQQARHTPFHDILIESSDENGTLFVSVGDADAKLSHWVTRVRAVWFEQNDDGLPAALEVETESGERTIVRFDRIPPGRRLAE